MKRFNVLFDWLLLNLLVVLPLVWILVGWLPDRLEVRVNSPVAQTVSLTSGSRVLGRVAVCAAEDQDVVFSLPADCRLRETAIRFERDEGASVTRLRLTKFGFLRFVEKHPMSFDLGSYGAIVGRPTSFAKGGGWLALAELVTLILACCGVGSRRRPEVLRELPLVLAAAFAFAFFFFAVLPVQSYLANRSLFRFGLGELEIQVSLRTVMAFAVSSLVLSVLVRRFGRIAVFGVLLVVLLGYLETGVLSAGLPALNGDLSYYEGNRSRAWIDLLSLTGVAIAGLACYRLIRGSLIWVALALTALSAASLFDTHVEAKPDAADSIQAEKVAAKDIACAVTYSPDRNVLIFVLDTMSTEVAQEALAGVPGLREKFSGFVGFPNNVGMHQFTLPAMAGMMTGEYLQDPRRSQDYFHSVFGRTSVIREAIDKVWNVYAMPGSYDVGCCSRPISAVIADGLPPSRQRVHGLQAWNLDEITRFRLTPFALKPIVLDAVRRGWDESVDCRSEPLMFAALASNGIRVDSKRTFLLSHTNGTHIPIIYDEDGNRLDSPDDTFSGNVRQAKYVLKCLGRLLDRYREWGIYDSSLIVVLADHGGDVWKGESPNGLPARAVPFLWVKVPQSRGEFRSDDRPTSHARLAEFFRRSLDGDMSFEQAAGLLTCENRLFRMVLYDGRILDWTIDAHGGVQYAERTVMLSEKDLRPLNRRQRYLLGIDQENVPDVMLEGKLSHTFSGLCLRDSESEGGFTFRVAGGSDPCAIRLTLSAGAGAKGPVVFFAQGRKSSSWSVADGDAVVLPDVRPGSDGLIRIVFRREGARGDISVSRLIAEDD